MSSTVSTFSSVPDELIELLTDRLPTSFTILRRLQSARSGSDTSPTARIVFVSDTGSLTATEAQGNASEQDGGNLHKPHALTVAYVDMAGGPDTQMWMYSTLEDARVTDVPAGEYDRQLEALAQRLVQMRHEHGKELRYPGCVLLGSVHSDTRKMLERCGRVRPRATGDYDKWLFREELLPQRDAPLPDGMHWDKANLADCEMVVSIATVPRLAPVLMRMQSLFIKLEDGTPVAWAFIGFDGSLVSLHCEEPYRRRGLAKAVASKLFREGTGKFGSDGWSSADVAADNEGSRGMCRALNGKIHWVSSWVLLDLADSV